MSAQHDPPRLEDPADPPIPRWSVVDCRQYAPPRLEDPTDWRAAVALLVFATLVCLAFGWCGCGASARTIQVTAANVMVAATEEAVPVLLEARRADGERCFAGTPTATEAEACLDRVRATWEPAWRALSTWSAAHASWATAIESGEPQDLASVQAAYCVLRAELLSRVELPDAACGVTQ